MSKHEYTCIVCPSSCNITVEDDGEKLNVSGFGCKHGKSHAINEHCNPKRILTTTIKIKNAALPRLPVISTKEIPKPDLWKCLELLYSTETNAPVNCGDIIIKNICGTGADIIAARSIHAVNNF